MPTSLEDPLGIIGATIDGRYRVLRLADEGGFAAVYKAEHLVWKQPVALKIFTGLDDTAPAVREQLLADFIREGKLMTELSSRTAAIVQARDVGRLPRPDGGWLPFMVLEWIDGSPLDEVLAREERVGLPARELDDVMRLLEPVAAALDIAHRRGVAHRDMKPANILVINDPRDPNVTLKLLDFGIAKIMEESDGLQEALDRTGQNISAFTPCYGAPEQFSRSYGATGPWTDVYALALIMVELLRGGEPALTGEGFFEWGQSSCNPQQRPTPRAFDVPIAPEAEAVFEKALAVAPRDRFANLGEFWQALHAVVHPDADTWRSGATHDSLPVISADPASVEARPARFKPWLMVGGVAVAALLAVAIGVGASIDRPQAALPPPGGDGLAASIAELATSVAAASSTPAAAPASSPCPANMRLVPGGSFEMGSNEGDFPLFKPAHAVTLDTYCLAVTEVTVRDYTRCVTRGDCTPAAKRPEYPQGNTADEQHLDNIEAFSELCNDGVDDRSDHPINCVDWHQAHAYCKAQGQRLPTEAEWEFAARGSDGRKFPWGDDAGDQSYMNAGGLEWKAWKAAHDLPLPPAVMYQAEDGFAATAPVGSFPRGQTQRGQLDMVGNVWEWTADWYALYDADPETNPKGPSAGERKAIRGGGFNGSFELWLNPAFRYHQLATASSHAIGFRCAADVAQLE